MDKILEMLKLQQELNDTTNGKEWEKGLTKHNKIIDWRRCIYMECAELIDSYPWKHWKAIDTKADYNNIKIETVDIWHFIISEALSVYKIEKQGSIEDLARDINKLETLKKFNHTIVTKNPKTYYQEIQRVEKLMEELFNKSDIFKIIETFIEIAIQSSLNLDELYSLYIGKNILNQFRQNNGYKEGTYMKVWNHHEDNVVMQNILENNRDITPEALYTQLNIHYPKN